MPDSEPTEVAVVYHSAARYREAVFRRLFGSSVNPRYTLFAGTTSNQNSIRLLDPAMARTPVSKGGLRWTLLRNIWLGEFLLQPGVLRLPFQRRWDCVIFLGNAYYPTTWIAALLCRLTGKRVLMWTHGFRFAPTGKRAWFKILFFKLAHGLILYGQQGKRILMNRGFAGENLYVAYNSLDHDAHLALRKRLCGKPPPLKGCFDDATAPVIVWVGRFIRDKEIPLLLKALDLLNKSNVSVNALLIGDGEEKGKMEDLSVRLGLDRRVHYPGPIYDEEKLARILMNCSLAVSPGPVGLFAIHALTFGLPLITNDDWRCQGPETEAIVQGVTGDFFAHGNAQALADAIAGWLRAHPDSDEVRAACMKQIDRFYHPAYQEKIIAAAVRAVPADSPDLQKT